MIVKNSNIIGYGIKELLFTTLNDFKSFTEFTEIGSKAYVVETEKWYILDTTNTWQELKG